MARTVAAAPAAAKLAAIAGPLLAVAAVVLALAVGAVVVSTAESQSACGAAAGAAEPAVAGFDGRYWRGPATPGPGTPPGNLVGLYFAAAQRAGLGSLGPFVLMAVHEIESGFGRSTAPGVRSGVNAYGCCKGPFQFYDMPGQSTWSAYARDGDGDGVKDVYSNVDAAFAAAAYLRASGAPGDWRAAVFAYNRAGWYVREVLARAAAFQGRVTAPAPQTAIEQAPALAGAGDGSTQVVGASEFGGPGDPGTGSEGYRGDDLRGRNAYAELGYSATTNESNSRSGLLGNLAYRTAARIVYRGREVTALKLDVGRGGAPVKGRSRAVDLWWETARRLRFSGTDVVEFTRLDGGGLPDARLGASPGCAAPAGVEQVATDGGPYQVPLPAGSFVVSSLFCERRSYESCHPGVDLAAPAGTPVSAMGAGRVVTAGWAGGYGNYTCIQHTQVIKSCYAHQSQIAVRVAETVQRGQRIGAVGSTGNSTGPHLHFEVRRGGAVVCPAAFVAVPARRWCAAGSPGFR